MNTQAARDHGAFAYSVDLTSGAVRALAGGVGLKYYSPGCGTGDEAVFTVAQSQTTQLLSANLATGKIDASVTAGGQVTSAVPTANSIVGVAGNHLVSLPAKGKPSVLATLTSCGPPPMAGSASYTRSLGGRRPLRHTRTRAS